MTEVWLSCGKTWFINNKAKRELDILIDDVINTEMDLFITLDGEEGSGKSYAGRGLAKYIATRLYEKGIEKEFTPENIHFRQPEYIEASKFGEKFDILLLDEGRGALGRGRSKANLEAIDWVSRCRFMRQFHIICVPAYHDLNPYISEWRSKAVVHFKKSYKQNKEGDYILQHGEYKMFCDLEGLRFHSRFRDYKYPKGWAAWDRWCPVEVFTKTELTHYNAKKEFYARLSSDSEIQKFSFTESPKKSVSDVAPDIIPTVEEVL